MKERLRRAVKYWRVTFYQTTSPERVQFALFLFTLALLLFWFRVKP